MQKVGLPILLVREFLLQASIALVKTNLGGPNYSSTLCCMLGAQATEPIKAYEMLGFYAGYACSGPKHEELAEHPPAAWLEARIAAGNGEAASKAEWKKMQAIPRSC